MQTETSEFHDQLVRGLTHRMNNILTLFHGYVGLLMENRKLDSATRAGLAKIKDGASAASDLIDRTHALVRPTASVWRELDVADFLAEMKPVFARWCPPSVSLELEVPRALPPLWTDVSRLKDALSEVVRNAAEAAVEGGTTVKIAVRAVPALDQAQSGWISFHVTDDGRGIPPEVEERIFQPFFSTKRKGHNGGLGLNVALEFVRQFHGSLRFTSEPGHTVFQLALPLRQEGA